MSFSANEKRPADIQERHEILEEAIAEYVKNQYDEYTNKEMNPFCLTKSQSIQLNFRFQSPQNVYTLAVFDNAHFSVSANL